MKFIEKNGLLIGLRDTGDQQHYLGMKVSKIKPSILVFKQFNPKGKTKASLIVEELLASSIQIGIDKYNSDNGKKIYLKEIEYVPFDSPNYDVYTIMTEAILNRSYKD